MTPFRSHGKGTLVLKGRFAGVRIERASGTNDLRRLADLKAMCRALAEAGRLDVLEHLARGRTRPLEVWSAYRSGSWASLPTPAHAWPFTERFERWRLGRAPHYQRDARSGAAQLLSIEGAFALGELGDVLLRYRARCETQGKGAMFNRVKGMLLGFLRDTVTRQHVLYQQCAAAPRLRESRKRLGDPQNPEQAATIRALLVEPIGNAWRATGTCRWSKLLSALLSRRSNFSGPSSAAGLACGPTTRGAPSRTGAISPASRRSAVSSISATPCERTSGPFTVRTRASGSSRRTRRGSRKWWDL